MSEPLTCDFDFCRWCLQEYHDINERCPGGEEAGDSPAICGRCHLDEDESGGVCKPAKGYYDFHEEEVK